jgi:hypothetical protein
MFKLEKYRVQQMCDLKNLTYSPITTGKILLCNLVLKTWLISFIQKKIDWYPNHKRHTIVSKIYKDQIILAHRNEIKNQFP